MSKDHHFVTGQKVRALGPLGLVTLDDPHHFLAEVWPKGGTGTVAHPPNWELPKGWLLVHVEGEKYAPVHPSHIEAVDFVKELSPEQKAKLSEINQTLSRAFFG